MIPVLIGQTPRRCKPLLMILRIWWTPSSIPHLIAHRMHFVFKWECLHQCREIRQAFKILQDAVDTKFGGGLKVVGHIFFERGWCPAIALPKMFMQGMWGCCVFSYLISHQNKTLAQLYVQRCKEFQKCTATWCVEPQIYQKLTTLLNNLSHRI